MGKNKIIIALIFIVLLTLGGIYGQLLTLFWTSAITVVSSYWIPIVIIYGIVWFIKDRLETQK